MHGDLNMPLAGDPPPKTDPARPALVLLVASVVELIAAVVLCTLNDDSCDGTTAYAISAGAVSVALALLVLSALRYDDAMPGLLLDMVPHLSAFLVLWWLPAWLTFTFVRPFAELCNGFFACWAALVAAIWLVRCELPAVDGFISRFVEVAQGTLAEKAYVAGLLCTSAFVWIEASILHSVQPSGWLAWTIGVGVVSFVACLCYLGAHEHVTSHSRHVALALLAWWLQGLVISFARLQGAHRLHRLGQRVPRAVGLALPRRVLRLRRARAARRVRGRRRRRRRALVLAVRARRRSDDTAAFHERRHLRGLRPVGVGQPGGAPAGGPRLGNLEEAVSAVGPCRLL